MIKKKATGKQQPSPKEPREPTTLKRVPPAEYTATEQKHSAEKTEPHQNIMDEKPRFIKFYHFFFKGKSAAWTAIFTFVLMVFTGLLYSVSKRANETSIASQRAFISATGIGALEKVPSDGKSPVSSYAFHVPFTNSGTTPTRNAIIQLAVAQQDTAPQAAMDFDALPQAAKITYVFGPKAAFDPQPMGIATDLLEQLEKRQKFIFIWGWVVYKDIFPDTPVHLSEFCVQIANPRWTKTDHSDPTVDMRVDTPPCPTHNCYDDNCADYSKRIEDYK